MNLGYQLYKFVLGPCGQDRSRRAVWPVDLSLLASEYFFNDAAHNWAIRILLTHLLGGPVGHRTRSKLWAIHQLWQALGAWAVCLDFCMPLACPCSFRVSPLVNSTARSKSAERHPLPWVPHSHCATHSAVSMPPNRRNSRGSAALLWGLSGHLLSITCGSFWPMSSLASLQCVKVTFSQIVLKLV